MGDKIAVKVTIDPGDNGHFTWVRLQRDPAQGWRKWYRSEADARAEALARDLASSGASLDPHQHRDEKSYILGNREIDPSELIVCGFVPIGTLSRLQNLVGKRGMLKLKRNGEVPFTFVSAFPPEAALLKKLEGMSFRHATELTDFLVRFDEGTLIDGSNTARVSGAHFSQIDWPY